MQTRPSEIKSIRLKTKGCLGSANSNNRCKNWLWIRTVKQQVHQPVSLTRTYYRGSVRSLRFVKSITSVVIRNKRERILQRLIPCRVNSTSTAIANNMNLNRWRRSVVVVDAITRRTIQDTTATLRRPFRLLMRQIGCLCQTCGMERAIQNNSSCRRLPVWGHRSHL